MFRQCTFVHKYTRLCKFIMWQTRKIESVFKLKDKNMHPSHLIYKGEVICGQTYIGETARNLEVRVKEHQRQLKIILIKMAINNDSGLEID